MKLCGGSVESDVRLFAPRSTLGGRLVHLVRHVSGCRVAMFQEDAADLVSQRATIDEIVARNKGADLAGPRPLEEVGVE
jgi:hypothetical protein